VNVAVVVLDTLRYDAFERHFGWLKGTRFTRAFSTSHWTGSAHASMVTGRYPSEVGVTAKSRSITCEAPLLYELLSESGYTTRVITNNLQIYGWDGWDRGVDHLVGRRIDDIDPVPEDAVDWRNTEVTGSGISKYLRALLIALRSDAGTVSSFRYGYRLRNRGHLGSTRAVTNRVRTMDFGDREFLLCNVMDTHGPYYAPEPYWQGTDPPKPTIEDGVADAIDDPDAVRKAYDACAAFLSAQYRALFGKLRRDFDLVVTVADHGELLGERGHWAHNHGLDPATTHVPLVVSGPGVPDRRVNTPVSVLDIHATLLDATDIDGDSRGQSLINNPTARPRFVEYHGLAEKRRQTFQEYGVGDAFDRYDRPLEGVVTDAGYGFQTIDDGLRLRGTLAEPVARGHLESFRSEVPLATDATESGPISEDVRRHLEELGYR